MIYVNPLERKKPGAIARLFFVQWNRDNEIVSRLCFVLPIQCGGLVNFRNQSLILLLGIAALGCGTSSDTGVDAGKDTTIDTVTASDTTHGTDTKTGADTLTDTNSCDSGNTCADASDAAAGLDASVSNDTSGSDTIIGDLGTDSATTEDTIDPEVVARLACQQGFLCVIGCGGGDSCQGQCLEQHPLGANRLDSMLGCVIDICGETPAESDPGYATWIFCTQDAQGPEGGCADETAQCLAGSDNCEHIVHCSNQCGNSENCKYLCRWTGTLMAQALYQAFRNCVYAHCSSICGEEFEIDACTACQTDLCGPKMQACQDD
ncbi:MAG: hypothetical protein CMH54_10575 [Myxococcales bacterium]|nr:hypothetical protein [Myxococcales bacterium]